MYRDQDSEMLSLVKAGKTYKLYRSPLEEMVDVFGLRGRVFRRSPPPVHRALSGVNLTAKKGERIGVLGRNGAGKSTLLKLVTGVVQPTEGSVAVRGRVQSISDLGIGFHPEFSGRENVRSALVYNELTDTALQAAIDDIVEFCELGQFIDLPVKTYSAGMMARIYFATATAIRPDILIVDEALGAGDAYFAARSAARMRQLALSGCTLLLVSHSTQQVLEFCERAIWIERGQVILDGPALVVVKAYEEFIQRLSHQQLVRADQRASVSLNAAILDGAMRETLAGTSLPLAVSQAQVALGGISAWPSSGKLRVQSVWFEDGNRGRQTEFRFGQDVVVGIEVALGQPGRYRLRGAIVIFDSQGRWATRLISPPFEVEGNADASRTMRCRLSPLLLGPDRYVLSVSLHEANEPWDLNSAERYDLLSRSFSLNVLPSAEDKLRAEWRVRHPVGWAKL